MMISGLLLAILMVLAVWIIAFYGFSSHNLLILLGLVVAPIGIFLLNNPAVWFVAILGIQQSGLIIPGLPQGLELVHVLMAGFVVVTIARSIIGDLPQQKLSASITFVYLFLIVLVITIAFRGIGLRALGSSKWGGMAYIRLFVSAGFFLASRYVTLSTRQWKVAIVLMLLFSFLPSISQIIFLASHGKIYHQYMFVQAYVSGLLGSLNALESSEGSAVRLHLLQSIGFNLAMMGVVFIPFRGAKKFALVFILAVSLFLIGLSGFRSSILRFAGAFFLYIMLVDKRNRAKRFLQALLGGGIMLVIVVALASYMPGPVQRAISWLPFANVDPFIRMQAASTVDWRIEIWKLAWREVPQYLVLGKGFAISPRVWDAVLMGGDSVYITFIAHNYHNGPLGALLDLGVMGLVSVTAFFLTTSIEACKNIKYLTDNQLIRRFYFFSLALYIYEALAFYFVFGDVRVTFAGAFISYAILYGIINTAKRERAELAAQEDMDKKPKRPFHRQPRINPFDQPDF